MRQAASRRAKSLGLDTKNVRMPRCTKTGAFEPIQCDNEIVSSCWCVDETGFELPGTRAPAAALVNCTGEYVEFLIDLVCKKVWTGIFYTLNLDKLFKYVLPN